MYLARTKRDFEKYFRREVLPFIRDMERKNTQASGQVNKRYIIDYPMRREEWSNIIDSLVKDRELPNCAVNWICPW